MLNTLELHIPTDYFATPRYKIGDTFYEVSFLRVTPELPSRQIIRIILSVLRSRPLLVKALDGTWVMYDTVQNNLRLIGSAPYFNRTTSLPTSLTELKIPRINGADAVVEDNMYPPFNEDVYGIIQYTIVNEEYLPPARIEVEGSFRAVQINTNGLLPLIAPSQSSAIRPLSPRTQSQNVPLSPRIGTLQSQNVTLSSSDNESLTQLSYQTLVKQLYGLPVEMPEFLIVNGLKVNFIPFSQVSSIQIDRYIIEPLLQPWAGPPGLSIDNPGNRILTIFGKNGLTYLVKALYDPVNNKIFSPI